jgi:pyruvate/2-oxoacid:ferredoxin oxidoreductase alpha subunit
MENGVDRGSLATGGSPRALARDARSSVFAVESSLSQRIYATTSLVSPRGSLRSVNAFGDEVVLQQREEVGVLARDMGSRAAEGERVALFATPEQLSEAWPVLRSLAKQRLPVVAHVFADVGVSVAFGLDGLGWCLLLAAGVEDSIDLTLVARRAAEDSGTPFLIVHQHATTRYLEPVVLPEAALCDAFVLPAAQRIHKVADPAHPLHAKMSERAFAERVPFALGSAMRGLEAMTGRRHDVIERTAAEGAKTMLVGAGALGEALLGEAERLRAAGYEVGAVRITALRPFPGPRLVRALARALVVTVLESSDEPLAQSNPLARELKAAFADALTWAPDYPGVGRLPRIHSGVVPLGEHALEAGDLDSIVKNMVDGEQGKRLFVFGSDLSWRLERASLAAPYAPGRLAVRARVSDLATANASAELCSMVMLSTLAYKSKVFVRPSGEVAEAQGDEAEAERGGSGFDLVAGRDRPRGVAALGAPYVVLLDDLRALHAGHPLARLARGGVVAVPTTQTTEAGFFDELPAYVKTIAFDRGVRLLGFALARGSDEGRRWRTAAALAGVLLFAAGLAAAEGHLGAGSRQALDGSLVEREVREAQRALGVDADLVDENARIARHAFEARIEVGRATVERDLGAIRLGRSDTRAGAVDG